MKKSSIAMGLCVFIIMMMTLKAASVVGSMSGPPTEYTWWLVWTAFLVMAVPSAAAYMAGYFRANGE